MTQAIAQADQPRIFNGGYTITSPKGGHIFVRIKTKLKGWKGWQEGDRYIELQNGQHWEIFGTVDEEGIHLFQYCRRKRTATDSGLNSYEAAALILLDLLEGGPDSRWRRAGYDYVLHGICVRCNRTLKDEVSIARGIGPDCLGKGWRRKAREQGEPD